MTSDRKNPMSCSPNQRSGIVRKNQKKDWVKKLEKISGKPLKIHKINGLVYLVIDCSSSMAGEDKINQAREGAIGFALEAQKKGYSVGLIQFSSYAEHISTPQHDIINFKNKVKRIVAQGSTNMSAGLQMAVDNFDGKIGEKVICVVTDGMPDNKKETINVAKKAKAKGIDIITIGTDDADKNFLEQLATRKDLSLKVSQSDLQMGIISAANMLKITYQ